MATHSRPWPFAIRRGMHAHFKGVLPDQIIADLPEDDEKAAALEALIARHADQLAAIIVEPLVQGAGGMIFHEAKFCAACERSPINTIFC